MRTFLGVKWMTSMSPRNGLARNLFLFHRNVTTQSQDSQSTLNQKEVEHFESLDYNFWWKSNQGKPLRSMNSLRIPLIRDAVSPGLSSGDIKPLSSKKILDIGCGGGIVSEPLARLGADVTGIDPGEGNISIANQHLDNCSPNLKSNLKYLCYSIDGFSSQPQNKDTFDAVVASEVLEHVDNLKLFISCAKQVLKPGGKFIVTTINQTLASQIFAIYLAESKFFNLVPKGSHSYKQLVSVNGLHLLLLDQGMKVESTQGMFFNPLTGNWSWTSSTLVNYAVVSSKP